MNQSARAANYQTRSSQPYHKSTLEAKWDTMRTSNGKFESMPIHSNRVMGPRRRTFDGTSGGSQAVPDNRGKFGQTIVQGNSLEGSQSIFKNLHRRILHIKVFSFLETSFV